MPRTAWLPAGNLRSATLRLTRSSWSVDKLTVQGLNAGS